MQELFEALSNFKPRAKTEFYIKVTGNIISAVSTQPREGWIKISAADYKKIITVSVENVLYVDGKFKRKAAIKSIVKDPEITKSASGGYELLHNDPFWPIGHREKGENLYKWETQ